MARIAVDVHLGINRLKIYTGIRFGEAYIVTWTSLNTNATEYLFQQFQHRLAVLQRHLLICLPYLIMSTVAEIGGEASAGHDHVAHQILRTRSVPIDLFHADHLLEAGVPTSRHRFLEGRDQRLDQSGRKRSAAHWVRRTPERVSPPMR